MSCPEVTEVAPAVQQDDPGRHRSSQCRGVVAGDVRDVAQPQPETLQIGELAGPDERVADVRLVRSIKDRHVPELADRFLREIKVQASLKHPNIAALHTALRVENQLLMLMEFVEGQTLEEKAGPLATGPAVDYISQALSALEYAHAHGVIHRDIKPNNVLVAEYDNHAVPKVIDFGVAKATAQKLTERTMFTEFGQVLGTMEYMSPEYARRVLDAFRAAGPAPA